MLQRKINKVMRMDRGVGSSILNGVHMIGLTEKVIFEQRHNKEVGNSQADSWGRYSWPRNLRWESICGG